MNFFKYLSKLKFSRYTKQIFFFGDLLILTGSFYLSQYLRFGSKASYQNFEPRTILILSVLFWIGLVLYFEAYEFVRTGRLEKFILKTLRIVFLHIVLIAFLIISLKFYNTSRLSLIYFYALVVPQFILFRFIVIKVLKWGRRLGYNYRTVVFLGCNSELRRMQDLLASDLSRGYRILGYFDAEVNPDSNLTYLGSTYKVENYIAENKVDELYIGYGSNDMSSISEIILHAEKKMTRVKIIPNFQQYTKLRKLSLDFYGSLPVLLLLKEPLENPINRLLKRTFDLVFSLMVITLVFPWLFPFMMILVKLTSKGPVFFKQLRTGEDGVEFLCYKFRTMKVNALSDELQATQNDKRLTAMGAFLRKTNIDELPQFFNVLVGNMSVVGPRPHMLKHTKEFSSVINNYLVRHFAKPGITGWAQVCGYRGETKDIVDIEKRVEYDIWYIENWTFYLDLKIIFLTAWNTIKGDKKAY
jgi:putative colanic acid biosynthesis UDP-glucose lipid carrier transferase